MKKFLRRTGAWLIALALLTVASVFAADTAIAGTPEEPSSVYKAIGLGAAAAFAIGISVLGAGYAVGRIGSAAMGAAAEKPELLTRSLLFVALAEGLAVLGFAIAMMIVQKI